MGSQSRIFFVLWSRSRLTKKNTGAGAGKKISALKPWYILYCMRTPLLPDIPRDFFAEFSAAEAALSKHSLIPWSGKMHSNYSKYFQQKKYSFHQCF